MCNRARYALFFSCMPKRKKSKVSADYCSGVRSALQFLTARLLDKMPFAEVVDLLQSAASDLRGDGGMASFPGEEGLDCAGVLVRKLMRTIQEVAGDA